MNREGEGPRLHLGVVTHPRSRFNVDGAAAVFAQSVADALGGRGARVTMVVSDRNDYDPAALPLSRSDLVRSAWQQSVLEYRWRRYLADGSAIADAALLAAMAARRMTESAIGALVPSSEARYGRTAARRLLNIDLSHLRVLDGGRETDADWVLVLEDDAWSEDVEAAAEGVLALIDRVDASPVQFASLSTSLSHDDLGVTALLRPAGELLLDSGGTVAVLAAARPITNTVCATLYRGSFAERVATGIRSTGLVPVVPIDWRLNQVILDLWSSRELGADSAVWVEPGLFLQRSMHEVG